jgi:hypothetical protein
MRSNRELRQWLQELAQAKQTRRRLAAEREIMKGTRA